MTDVHKEIVVPILTILDGKQPDETLAALTFIVAAIMHQTMMPAITEREVFDAGMALFKQQVQEDLVMIIEEAKL